MPVQTDDDSGQQDMTEGEKAAKQARIAAHKEKWLKHFDDLEAKIKTESEAQYAIISQQQQQTASKPQENSPQLTTPTTGGPSSVQSAPPADQQSPLFESGESHSPTLEDGQASTSAEIEVAPVSPLQLGAEKPSKPRSVPKGLGTTATNGPADTEKSNGVVSKNGQKDGDQTPSHSDLQSQVKKLTIDTSKKRRREQGQSSASPIAPSTSVREQKKSKTNALATASSSASPPVPSSLDARSGPLTAPDWYLRINLDKIKIKNRSTLVRLIRITDLIRAAKKEHKGSKEVFEKIRDEIHDLEFIAVSPDLLRKANLLDNERGIPQLFHPDFKGSLQVPWDIESDSLELYYKWIQRIFTPDLLRGIDARPKPIDKSDRKGWSIKSEKLSALYFGNGSLVNGQWWPRQICAVRDGAHGAMIAGITGIKGEGAVSVVMSGAEYNEDDEDNGENVWYCGTASNDPTGPTEATNYLILSLENQRPVRLMRSSNIPNSPFKPSHGFRYDGLYDIVEKELISKVRQHYRFRLVRQRDQPPIRYKGVEARPTPQEIEALQKLERDLGVKGWSD
jgi:hypothetical protein